MKRKTCRYCRAGYSVKENGEHWIVKSIIPARIDIRKCTAVERTPQPGAETKE
jgi:hypothetical protein